MKSFCWKTELINSVPHWGAILLIKRLYFAHEFYYASTRDILKA